MRIYINSDLLLQNTIKDIALITDCAIVSSDNVEFDKQNSTVKILLQRPAISGFKKNKWVVNGMRPIYKGEMWIDSLITIKNVKKFDLVNNSVDGRKKFSVSMGITIIDNSVLILSQEDNYGTPFYEINIEIEKLDIEINDISDEYFVKRIPYSQKNEIIKNKPVSIENLFLILMCLIFVIVYSISHDKVYGILILSYSLALSLIRIFEKFFLKKKIFNGFYELVITLIISSGIYVFIKSCF